MDFFGIPVTEEMRNHMEKQEMAQESFRHDLQRLWLELSQDHLITVRSLLGHISSDESGKVATYFEGVATATITHRFNVCAGCGKNHDEELETDMQIKDMVKPGEVTDDEIIDIEGEIEKAKADMLMPGQGTLYDVPVEEGGLNELTTEQFAEMEKYNLDDVRDRDTLKLIGFVCKGCGMSYVSIEDRALRAVDDCGGCIQKAKWG